MFSWAVGNYQNELESSKVNEPSVFEPLRFYCSLKYAVRTINFDVWTLK